MRIQEELYNHISEESEEDLLCVFYCMGLHVNGMKPLWDEKKQPWGSPWLDKQVSFDGCSLLWQFL